MSFFVPGVKKPSYSTPHCYHMKSQQFVRSEVTCVTSECCLQAVTPCDVVVALVSQEGLCPWEVDHVSHSFCVKQSTKNRNSASTHIFSACQRTVAAAFTLAQSALKRTGTHWTWCVLVNVQKHFCDNHF